MSKDDMTTSWRLLATRTLGALNVVVTIDTVAPVIVAAIEEAARKNGIVLERVVGDDEPAEAEESTPPPVAPGSVSNLVITGQSDARHQ